MIFKAIKRSLVLIAMTLIIIVVPVLAVESKPLPKPVSINELNTLLETVENNFSQVKTLRTLLTQEKNITLFSETIISKGMCIFKSPDKLRLDFIEPFQSSLIINNNDIFKYEFFNGNWQKLDTGNKEMMILIMENITSWLQGRFKDPELYEISAFKTNENVFILLAPRADEFKHFIRSFELGLNREMNGLDYIIINETKNNYTKIKFHNDEINKEISDSIFEGTNDKPGIVPQW